MTTFLRLSLLGSLFTAAPAALAATNPRPRLGPLPERVAALPERVPLPERVRP